MTPGRSDLVVSAGFFNRHLTAEMYERFSDALRVRLQAISSREIFLRRYVFTTYHSFRTIGFLHFLIGVACRGRIRDKKRQNVSQNMIGGEKK